MKFNFLKHYECSNEQIIDICKLKQQSWQYSITQQKEWITNNINSNDYHLLLEEENQLIGYLSLIHLSVEADDDIIQMFGVGNVCVEKYKRGQKIGFLLMELVNYFIYKKNKIGILLCNEQLLSFYIKCNWNIFRGEVFYNKLLFEKHALLSEKYFFNKIEVSKLF